jgi:hypothetical protein
MADACKQISGLTGPSSVLPRALRARAYDYSEFLRFVVLFPQLGRLRAA